MTTSAEPAVRRTLARLRLCRMQMRRDGKLATQGAPINLRRTDVARTWSLYDYVPPSVLREQEETA